MKNDKVILITGAAGSIGEILVKNLSKSPHFKLILFDRNENDLYFLKEKNKNSESDLVYVLGDILDKEKVSYVFHNYPIDYVIHCAAYKHVPLMEMNLYEAIRNNVEGLFNIIDASKKFYVTKFLFISSDKAVYPSSLMGLTKRAGELIIEKENLKYNNIQFLSLRFSNLLNSNGSILPLFERQFLLNGKISVTDQDASRFFIDEEILYKIIDEAINYNGKRSLLIGDYTNEIIIKDLAASFLLDRGIENISNRIEYVGLRPGEKLNEDLKYSFEKKHELKENLIFEIDSAIIIDENYIEDLKSLILFNSPGNENETKKLFFKIMKNYINEIL